MIKHLVEPHNAGLFNLWIQERGGVAVWKSINLSNPGFSMSSPVLDQDGNPTTKPNWQLETTPSDVYTDPADIGVIQYEEAARFPVRVRVGSNGLSVKLTDSSSRHLERRLRAWRKRVSQEWAEWVTHRFDYEFQEAVILIPVSVVSLPEYLDK